MRKLRHRGENSFAEGYSCNVAWSSLNGTEAGKHRACGYCASSMQQARMFLPCLTLQDMTAATCLQLRSTAQGSIILSPQAAMWTKRFSRAGTPYTYYFILHQSIIKG